MTTWKRMYTGKNWLLYMDKTDPTFFNMPCGGDIP